MVGLSRLELLTSPLSGVCSNQLSYRPCNSVSTYLNISQCVIPTRQRTHALYALYALYALHKKGIVVNTCTSLYFNIKQVIQPQVPLRLPCYEFTRVADPTEAGCPPCGLTHRRLVRPTPMV